MDEPERLFSAPEAAKAEARLLFRAWHPDRCADPHAAEVFDHLQKLLAEADRKQAQGRWETPGLLRLEDAAGTRFEMRYASKLAIDVGTMYVGRKFVGFDITTDNVDLLDEAQHRLTSLPYFSSAMREEFRRYFPAPGRRIETGAGAFWLVPKDPEVLLLKDVLAHFNGRMPARHVAWVLSRLLNIACYLEVGSQLAHNAIGPDTVFISPAAHSAHLLGGWWFAARLGAPLIAASPRMLQHAPPAVLQKKLGDSRTDMEMLKALGRELLGDPAGTRLSQDPEVPAAMSDWLQLTTHQDAVSTYQDWQERVLVDAFGPRKFVELNLTHATLYPQQA